MDLENDDRNIVLIGMPGAGKSTTGVLLAKALSRGFLDTDVNIQALECRRQVIATGGAWSTASRPWTT